MEPEPSRPTPGGTEEIAAALLAFLNSEIMAPDHPMEAGQSFEAAGVDSLALLKVLLFVERTFGFWIPDADLTREVVRSPATLAAYIHGRIAS